MTMVDFLLLVDQYITLVYLCLKIPLETKSTFQANTPYQN